MNQRQAELDCRLRKAARVLGERLKAIDVDALAVDSFYRDRYLKEKLGMLESATIRARSQLGMALSGAADPAKVVLVDHGGGTGTTGMLAKLAGIGTVIYNDIDPKMLEIAGRVGDAIGAESDHYVLGDFDVLLGYLQTRRLSCDALVSYDVIEHIYDMERFIAELGRLSRGPFAAVMSSGANMFNPRYLLKVVPTQKRAQKEWQALRLRSIRDLAPALSEEDAARLAASTRYCTRSTIEQVILRYQDTGVVRCDELSAVNRYDPYGTNTCDPETGWWAEHLMNPWYLKGRLQAAGFEVCVKTGLYGRPDGILKSAGARIVNTVLRGMGAFGIVLAAYYTLWARRTGPSLDYGKEKAN